MWARVVEKDRTGEDESFTSAAAVLMIQNETETET